MKLLKILLPFLLLCTISCNLLNQKSPNDLDSADVFTSPAAAENALVGCYSSMQSRDYYGVNYQLLPDACTDDISTGGYDVASLDEFNQNLITPANLYIEQTWISIYRTIANCNSLILGLDEINAAEFAAGQRGRIEGEAKFIRALAHFDALRWYGEHWKAGSEFGIPLVINDKSEVRRSAVNDTYLFIIKELENARPLVSQENTRPIYVNSSTIDALLARVFLYKKDFVKAKEYSEKITAVPNYNLNSDVIAIFSGKETTESIFELAFDIRSQSGFNQLTFGRTDALKPELFFMADQNLKTFFENRVGDTRAQLFDFINNDQSILPDGRSQKYRGETTKDNPAYVLRLAEMYLILAEAKFHISGLQAGLDALNFFRTKRGLSTLTNTQVPDNETFIIELLDERRAELNFEGHRFFDLVRTERFESTTGAAAFRAVFPIATREITASGGVIKQNPGYN
jgi:starch-binding outer membrane protein, SusD/RagB family